MSCVRGVWPPLFLWFLFLLTWFSAPMSVPAAGQVQVRIRKNVMMPARDGVRLATDVYLPDGDVTPPGPFPAILIRSPYNKDGLAATAEFFTTHGYAVAAQDVRGRFASEGEFYIYVNEGPDGFDAVEWVAEQPWCNGEVGTYGGSYLAATQNALAVLRPPHLRTMFVLVGTSNYIEDGAGRGGAFALLHNMAYAFRLAATGKAATEEEQDGTSKPTASALAQDEAYERLADWLRAAPLRSKSPLDWTPSYAKWYADWRAHPTYDDYWKQNGYNFEEYYSQYPNIPICFIGGWYDIFKRGTLQNFMGLASRNPATRLVMGPWTHSTGKTFAGDVDFGKAAEVDLKKRAVRWFDRHLKGLNDDSDPQVAAVEYFLMGGGTTQKTAAGRLQSGGQWKFARRWPPAGYRPQKYYLHHNGSLQLKVGASAASRVIEFDPRDPVPTIGGNIDSGKQLVRRGAQNQVLRKTDLGGESQLPLYARHDVLTFETPPLDDNVEVVGPIQVVLWVSSSARDTDLTAKLIDVYPPSVEFPAGYAMNLEDGILRMRFRDSRDRETLLEPGETYRVTIDLWATANRFLRGHRIRLDISSSNFPMYDVNPNSGEPLGQHTRMASARNTLLLGPEHPSHLVLPVR